MKTKKLYEIRSYNTQTSFSKTVGRKLRNISAANKIVKRLRKSGIDAFKSPLTISV